MDTLLGKTLDRRYLVSRRLGAGNVGVVYEARHVELGRTVALKVLHPALVSEEGFEARFIREGRSVSRLQHPGCVALLDFGRVLQVDPDDASIIGTPYLVMEFVAGEPLEDRLERGALPVAEAIAITGGVLAALAHAHGLQIVHRDLKPANIMLAAPPAGAPAVKLVDFGLARELGGQEKAITQVGMVFGTPSYLSPEQARGEPPDPRSDLYSLGVILFELLAGQKPFSRDTPLAVVRDHLVTPAPRLRSLSPSLSVDLDAVVARALEKDAAQRFQTASAFHAALLACPEGGAPSPARRRDRKHAARAMVDAVVAIARSRPRLAAGVAAGLALALGLIVFFAGRSPEPTLTFTPTEISLHASPSAQRHLALAEDYQRKLWCTDAIEELTRALKDDVTLRESSDLVRIATPCLRPKSQQRTLRFLVDQIGRAAIAPLELALREETRAELRDGIARTLGELRSRTQP